MPADPPVVPVAKPAPLSATPWKYPEPLGYFGSIQAAGGLAAPLLAGFSFTVLAVILPATTGAQQFNRWPNLTLSLLLSAGMILVAAVEASVWARRYGVTPDEILAWWPVWEAAASADPATLPKALKNMQAQHFEDHAKWARRTAALYEIGIILLFAGIATSLVPPGPVVRGRGIAIAIAFSGLAANVIWIAWARAPRSLKALWPFAVSIALGVLAVFAAQRSPNAACGCLAVSALLGSAAMALVGLFRLTGTTP